MWKPIYNPGRSRAGGFNAKDGWYVAVELADGRLYVPGQNNPNADLVPIYSQQLAQEECDILNGKRSKRKTKRS